MSALNIWHRFHVAMLLCAALVFSFEAAVPSVSQAREFRSASRILTPELLAVGGGVAKLSALEGRSFEGEIPIPRQHVEDALEQVLDAWGGAGFHRQLADDFVDGQRLAESAQLLSPRDAEVRVLGISGIQVLGQTLQEGQAPSNADLLLSRVSVTAQTQLEFLDQRNGTFRILRGTNDYVLLLKHRFQELPE